MKPIQKRVMLYGAVFVGGVLMLGTVTLPFLARSSNCGGNSAALNACRSVHLSFRVIASENDADSVSIASLTPADREQFNCVMGLGWIGDAKILVSSRPLQLSNARSNVLLAVCDAPYDNVPQRRWFKTPPRHAAIYEDGTTALLSTEQFRRLDLTGFVDVRSLQTSSNRTTSDTGSENRSPVRQIIR